MTDGTVATGTRTRVPEQVGFEELMQELERIVRELDGGEIELEEALALFQRGVSRLQSASRLLDSARGQVEELIEATSGELAIVGFEAGEPETGITDGS